MPEEPEAIQKLKELRNYIKNKIPSNLVENLSLMKSLDKITNRVSDSERRLWLRFNEYTESRQIFTADAESPDFSEDRISLNGKVFSKDAFGLLQEMVLIIEILSDGFMELMDETGSLESFARIKGEETLEDLPKNEELPFDKLSEPEEGKNEELPFDKLIADDDSM